MKKKFFGTDGIRGHVGTSPITPEFVLKLGWAVGTVLSRNPHNSTQGNRRIVLIGKDTRISGYMFESALEAGLAAAGMDIRLLGPMPTPAIAYLTRTLRAELGIVISASHNPFHDNGIKLFSSQGTKLPDEIEMAIEAQLEEPMVCLPSAELGRASRVVDAPGRYIEFCKSALPPRITLNGMRILVDCAQGSTYHVAPKVFSELGANVTALNNEPNGLNINEQCGSTHPQSLIKAVLANKADIGIALDGDGDRVILVDHEGKIVDGDDILYILGKYHIAANKTKGGIVGTLMSNLGLELGLQTLGVPFKRTNVGDRHVLQTLQTNNWLFGGEPSGHIICLEKNTCGDGIVAALQVLKIMQETQRALPELLADLRKLPQHAINVRKSMPENPCDNPNIQSEIHKMKTQLGDSGRIILRCSGTEPLIRIMVEGEDRLQVTQFAQALAAMVED